MSMRALLSVCVLALVPLWSTAVMAQPDEPGVVDQPIGDEDPMGAEGELPPGAEGVIDDPLQDTEEQGAFAPGEVPPGDDEMAEAQPEGASEEGGGMVDVASMTPEEKEAYKQMLLAKVVQTRDTMVAKIEDKMMAKQEEKNAFMAEVLGWFSLSGLLLLLMPLFLRKKYPGNDGLLVKYSVLASGTFIVSMLLFTLVLVVFRQVQGGLGAVANPQIALVEAGFASIENNIDDVLEMAPMLIEAPLAQVAAGEADSVPMALLNNAQKLRADFKAFDTVKGWMNSLSGLMGYLPPILSVIAVLLFLVGLKDVMLDIVKLPERVVRGEVTGGQTMKLIFGKLTAEMKSTGMLLLLLIFIMIFSSAFLSVAVEPAIEAFMAYTFVGYFYVAVDAEASTGVIYGSLGGALAFVLLNVVAIFVTTLMFLGKAQKIFRAKYHEKVPFKAQKFWKWGFISLLWAFILPPIYISFAQPAVEALIDSQTSGDDISFSSLLLTGPLILTLGFIVFFWLVRGLKAMMFIIKFKPIGYKQAADAAIEQAAVAAQG
ncbi:MAG: hypothetical protein ACE366_07710 [Bradymonadia bacterium]